MATTAARTRLLEAARAAHGLLGDVYRATGLAAGPAWEAQLLGVGDLLSGAIRAGDEEDARLPGGSPDLRVCDWCGQSFSGRAWGDAHGVFCSEEDADAALGHAWRRRRRRSLPSGS